MYNNDKTFITNSNNVQKTISMHNYYLNKLLIQSVIDNELDVLKVISEKTWISIPKIQELAFMMRNDIDSFEAKVLNSIESSSTFWKDEFWMDTITMPKRFFLEYVYDNTFNK